MKSKSPMRKFEFVCLLVLLGLIATAATSGFAQNAAAGQNPLNFANNFFVTGDYIVAGAYNMTSNFQNFNGVTYAVGTINVPDNNPGIQAGVQGEKQVPKGAQILVALLYWQTVEKVGQLGSGQNGYFRPLLYQNSGGPAAPGYAISGSNVSGSNTVSWSSGGCSGGSTGKVLQTYRADVTGGLPNDASGNPVANGSFEVRLPSVGSSSPLTLGATLVVIYRIPTGANGPNVPLNSIVIYDGDYAQSSAQLSMTQQIQGFYDADRRTISRLTHIVGSGQANKFQTVFLGSANPLTRPYGKNLPYFPGWYGNWDNPTWTFSSGTSPLAEDSSAVTTQVVPSMSNQGCVSWGAIIVSTTVKNPDNDGILFSWKKNQGYCDVSVNASCSGPGDPAWVDLTGAAPNQKDVFLQYDYMCSKVTGAGSCDSNIAKDSLSAVANASGGTTTYTGTISNSLPPGTLVGIAGLTKPANEGQFTVVSSSSTQLVVNNPNGVAETNPGVLTYAIPGDQNYSFDPRLASDPFGGTAVDKVVASYDNSNGSRSQHTPIVLHAIPGNAIAENQQNVSCSSSDPTCVFPNEPGTVGFRAGLSSIKNTYVEPSTGLIGCDPGKDVNRCIPVFQHGKKDSYHYALFSHGVGTPTLFLSDGSLQNVKQTGNTVTFTTKAPHGISQVVAQPNYATATDTMCPSGRVTVILAITNLNLNGTYCVLSSPAPTATTFSIRVGGNPATATYTSKTDPNMAVANGQVTSISGLSDLGGDDSVISLGYGGWGPPTNPFADGNQWQDKAGTFMHELGHTMFLSHGGTFYNNYKPTANPPVIDYTPSYEANCKPNLQSNMSYLFQFDLLQVPGLTNPDGTPLKVVDYSEESLPTLTESSPQPAGVLDNAFYATTSWFELLSFAGSGSTMSTHCDFTGLLGTDKPTVAISQKPVSQFGWSAASGTDINFNGASTDVMNGHDEWDGTAALGATGPAPGVDLLQVSALGTLSAVGLGGEQGGLHPSGGGLHPSGGGLHPSGGGLHPSGGSEMTHEQACSYPRSPANLTILQEEASPRYVDLSWFAPNVCQPVNYKVYRSVAGGAFTVLATLPGSQTTYQDTTATCNASGYSYEVTAVENNAGTLLESAPSNTVPAPGEPLLTGCYTAPVNVAVQGNGVQGDIVPITWTLTDDFYAAPPAAWSTASAGNPVTNQAASTLVAVGPDPNNSCAAGGRTTLLLKGVAQSVNGSLAGTFANSGDQFTFTSDTDVLCAGSYKFELDLDSGQKFTSGPLQLSIDVNDQDAPRITTLSLPAGTVGLAYPAYTLSEDGGSPPFTWSFSGLPSGISQPSAGSPTISGTTCAAGTYAVNASVTDGKSNSGSQGFSLQINKANTTTSVGSNANPSVFQQLVTYTVTVAPQYSCTPTGTVTLYDGQNSIGSTSLTNGSATFMLSNLSVGIHSISASYGGDGNFNSSNSGVWSQTVNPAQTQLVFNTLSPSTVFVGQPITISYTFGVVAPGAGTPIAPTGNITVTASDGSSCMAAAVLGGGMCTLSPAPNAAGNVTFQINYAGDGNFVASASNGNYNVYQLVFTTQPGNTGVGRTMTPAVVVTAEDSSNTTLAAFTGGITLAIGSGPGTLSGTTTQNAVSGVATFNDLSINKVANGYTLVASPSGGFPAATSNAFNIDTFYVDGTGNFGTLDVASATVNVIGTGTLSTAGLDLTPNGQVYVYDFSNQLKQVDTSSGLATNVGSPGNLPNPFATTIAALTDGSFFALDAVTGNLYSINLTTGATTLVGSTSTQTVASRGQGCGWHTSMAGSASVLYYTIGISGQNCTSPVPDILYQVNSADGSTTTIGPTSVSGFIGSGFVGGKLYGFTGNGNEYVINVVDGTTTLVGNTNALIFGAGDAN